MFDIFNVKDPQKALQRAQELVREDKKNDAIIYELMTLTTGGIGRNPNNLHFVDLRFTETGPVLVLEYEDGKTPHEIVYDEGLNLNEITDFVVNMVPEQGTETVRTEEAIFASLAILNLHLSW